MDYIYDQVAVENFGKIFGTVSYSDLESPLQLLEKAKEDIKDLVNLSITIELTAIDLKDLGYDVKKIDIGDKIPVISKPHGINSYMQVSKISKNLKVVDDCKVTLGSTLKTLVENQNTYNSGIKNAEATANGVVAKAAVAEKNATAAADAAKNATKTAEEIKESIGNRTVGNKYGNVPYISNEGTMQVGKTIGFHSTDNYPEESDGKLYVEDGVLYFCDKTGTVKTIQMQEVSNNGENTGITG